jgi:arylsulfatase A-like enzyme
MVRKQKSVKGLNRRQVLKYGLSGGLAAGLSPGLWLSGCGGWWQGKKPNVLLIVLDTARADRFSCFGYERKTSPNIDAMALESVVYECAYSPSCWTLPSHASLFTGLYPIQAGATSETLHLPLSNTTVTEALKKTGYDTAAFVCNAWVNMERGFAQGFTEFYEMWRHESEPDTTQGQSPKELTATKKVISWFERRKKAENPFFVFINLNCVHLPYCPPEPFLSRFAGNRGYYSEEVNRVGLVKSMWSYLAGELKLSERDFHIMNDLYDGEVAFADRCVGQIIEQLRNLGILDETVVIVTSDHGENLGERGRIDHSLSMYETTLHIPLVIRYPRRFRAGTRNSDLVSFVDIAPTILELCNVREGMEKLKPDKMSLAREDRPRRVFVVAGNERPLAGIALMKDRYSAFDTSTIDFRMRSIRTDSYKLIWNVERGKELFDLRADPGELHDLAGVEIETRDKLHRILYNWLKQIPSAGDVSFLEGQDEESMRILRSLGYLK